MAHTFRYSNRLFRPAVLFAIFAAAVFAQDDPPTRVARLNYISGNVSMEPAGVDDWSPATINRPFTIGDYLYADQSSVAELHMDSAVLRAGQLTSFGFLNLTDQAVQLKMTEGDMYFRLHDLDPNQSFEVDTPNAAITLLREGVYRIHVDPNANTTFVFAKTGEAEVTGGGQAFTLNPGNSATLSGTDQLAFDIEGPPAPDAFDNWCDQRDVRESRMPSHRYLPPTMVGAEDLDDYGAWSQEAQYGAVWYPRNVPAGWAPYHSGHWAWIEPWGWTWVDDNPWGYAPFHYGRWVYGHDRWGWAPGPCARLGGYGGYGGPVIRPVYAPALVAFFGGAHWGVSVGIGGGGPSLGWVPLGWGEVYTPSYHCSPRYFNNVNVNNTRITNTTNITNVYNTVYVNKTVYNQNFVNVRSPNAVAAMTQSAFASGRSVSQGGATVTQAQLARFHPAQASMIAPPVAPMRQALAPGMGRPAAAPQAQIAQRQVIARNTPPPAPASFASRQSFLQQHAGQPHDFAAMRQATVAQARPAAAEVRQVARIQPAIVHQGQHVGNVPAAAAVRTPASGGQQPNRPVAEGRPGRNPAQPSRPVQPIQPGEQAQPGHPIQPVQPGHPSQPVQQVQPGHPMQPAQQPYPVQPVRPAQQVQPAHGAPPNLRQAQPPSDNNVAVRPTMPQNGERRAPYNGAPEVPARPAVQQPQRQPTRPNPAVEAQPQRTRPEPTQQMRPTPIAPRQQTPAESPRTAEERANQQPRRGYENQPQRPQNQQVERPQNNAPREQHGTPPRSEKKEEPKPEHKQN